MLETAVMCLALNIYHEARSEPLVGQIAVAEVVLNRVESPRFPDSICAVVKEGEYRGETPIRNKCQFSWWCDGKSDKPKDSIKWEQSINLAYTMLEHPHIDITEGSLFYHAVYVNPSWANDFEKVVTIDNHIFYR